jgi:hypothetical protein
MRSEEGERTGRAVAQAVSRWLPTAAVRVRVGAEHVGFVVDKAALGQVFSEYFDFPGDSLFHQFLHQHNHTRLAQKAYWWPQCRVDPIGLHPPLYQFKNLIKKRGQTGERFLGQKNANIISDELSRVSSFYNVQRAAVRISLSTKLILFRGANLGIRFVHSIYRVIAKSNLLIFL